MGETAIKFENISKQYRLGLIGTGTLSHDLKRWWTVSVRGKEDPYLKIGSGNNRGSGNEDEYVWALRDINLEVKQGEVLGIIGKNGAGKSTLLKLLSRVTSPTTGIIKTRGRIASLLEVGTGFHPEMTGRENVYMNGSIMGMTKAEVRRKFDEIVSFAGVEKYIDTPVKRYSSGMTVRLGFAIAAHLDPEILVVDEVLAVGDAEFQKKAVGKMQDVGKNYGRTVLFVSHNMGLIRTLCPRTIVLGSGEIIGHTNTDEAIHNYLFIKTEISSAFKSDKTCGTYIKSARFIDENGNTTTHYDSGDRIKCEITINITNKHKKIHFSLALYNRFKNRVFTSDHPLNSAIEEGSQELKFLYVFPDIPFSPGNYSLNLVLHEPNISYIDSHDDILPFTIVDKGSDLSRYSSFAGDIMTAGEIVF